MNAKVIRTEQDHAAALARIDALMAAEPGTEQGEELDLLVTLVELYEKKAHPIPLPDPVAAIKFRMEQAQLNQTDMIPYLGSRSKVSEVLSGKRSLSLPMMRRLHEGLGIPAAVLLSQPGGELPASEAGVDWARFPIVEMCKRHWIAFKGPARRMREDAEKLMRKFVAPFDDEVALPMCARQHVRDGGKMDAHALCAWKIRVMKLAHAQQIAPYSPGTVTQDFIREVLRLSYLANGPTLAREYLAKAGIHLVTELHLPKTYLDGAALLMPDGNPLIALTLRYDRLDNFWFTLAHELAHVALHLDGTDEAFFDDLEAEGKTQMETDADRLASDSLIPHAVWQAARLSITTSPQSIEAMARELRISSAIPAGRIRHESGNHRIFWRLVGKGQVRRAFAAKPVSYAGGSTDLSRIA